MPSLVSHGSAPWLVREQEVSWGTATAISSDCDEGTGGEQQLSAVTVMREQEVSWGTAAAINIIIDEGTGSELFDNIRLQ